MALVKDILKSKRRGDVDTSGLFPVEDDGAVATAEVVPVVQEAEDFDGFDRHVPRGRSMPATMQPKSSNRGAGIVRPRGKTEVEQAAEKYFADARIIARSLLKVSDDHPRSYFELDAVLERRASMRSHGIIQPFIVRPVASWEKAVEANFSIIKGALRFYASLPHEEFVAMFPEADGKVDMWEGITEIPVVVRAVTRDQALALSVILATQQAEWGPSEKGGALNKLQEEMSSQMGRRVSMAEVGDSVGLSRKTVQWLSGMAKLPEDVKDKARDAGLSQRQLMGVTTLRQHEGDMRALLNKIIRDDIPGERALEMARQIKEAKKAPVVETRSVELNVVTPSMLEVGLQGLARAVSMVAHRVGEVRETRQGLRAVPPSLREQVKQEVALLRQQADELERLVA